MDDLLNSISDAVSRGDWLQVSVIGTVAVVTLVAAALKAAGKPVPVLDQILGVAKSALKLLPRKSVEPKPGEKTGVEAVVPVEVEKKVDP